MGEPAKLPKLWKFNPATEKFDCSFPDCTYSHDDPGGVNLHSYKKHGPNPARPPASTSRKTDKSKVKPMQKRVQQPNSLGHDWRLLNPRDPMERAAIAKGASEICADCQEVR